MKQRFSYALAFVINSFTVNRLCKSRAVAVINRSCLCKATVTCYMRIICLINPIVCPCYKLKGKIAESADKRKRNYIYKCTSAKYFFQTLHHPVYQVNNRKIKENAALLAKHYEYGREIEPFILLFFLSTTISHFQFFIFNLLNLSFYRISSLVCSFDEGNKSPTRHNT